jgi:3-methylcrotonyl-CoA carboxylase alpha subunit
MGFLQQLVKHPAFLAGKTDTGFIHQHRATLMPDESHIPDRALIAASLHLLASEGRGKDAWDRKDGWWLNRGAHRAMEFHTLNDEEIVTVDIETVGTIQQVCIDDRQYTVTDTGHHGSVVSFATNGHAEAAQVFGHGDTIAILFADARHTLRLVDPFRFEGDPDVNDGRLTAMMPGRVVKVMASVGDSIKKGQALIIMEAMKMEHTIFSPRDGVVERVAFKENDLVAADAVLFAFAE